MKLLIRNLARTTTEAELKSLFEEHGVVQSCTLILDKKSGASKGFAFIEMPKAGHAKIAIKSLNGRELSGNKIRVKKAEATKDNKDEENTTAEKEAVEPAAVEKKSKSPKKEKPKKINIWKEGKTKENLDPLHGITLETVINHLVNVYGWKKLSQRINIKCFTHDPSLNSSLTFLRKTAWARKKVEALYLESNSKSRHSGAGRNPVDKTIVINE